MSRPSWNQVWMQMADLMGQRSKCVRAQVGAIIVTRDQRVVSTGYNGPPAAMFGTSGPCSKWCPRARSAANGESVKADYTDCFTSHAEANALLYGDATLYRGGTIYVSSSTCYGCAKLVANSGIKTLIHRVDLSLTHRDPELTEKLLRESNVEVIRYND